MKIFEKRPLSLILCIMLGGFSLFVDSDIVVKLVLIAFSLLIFTLTFVKGLIGQGKRLLVRICIIAFATSILLGMIWSANFYPLQYTDGECKITATVTDLDKHEGYTRTTLKTEEINGNKATYTFIAHVYSDVGDIELGDVIECNATLLLSKDTGKDSKSSYNKDGISAILENISDFKIIGHKQLAIKSILIAIRKKITTTLTERTNSSTGGFISALLIGDRDNLDRDTALSFKRIGISHILALSGMHLSVISLAIERLLRALGVSKKLRILLMTLFTLEYMALAGFAPSITRSGIMLITYYALFLLARSRDTFTSLCISVSLIALITPHAVFDISLWLSALATLGIITAPFLNKYSDRHLIVKWLVIGPLNALIASIFAIGATVLITVTTFNEISIFSVFATLIFSPITTVFMYLSILLLIFGGLIPFGNLMIVFSDLIKELAEIFARPSLALCSLNSVGIKLLIIFFTALLIAFLVLDVKRKGRATVILSALFLLIHLAAGIRAYTIIHQDNAKYIKGDESDCVLIKNDGEVSLITTAEMTLSYAFHLTDTLNSEELKSIDRLVVTSYTQGLENNIQGLINSIKTDLILLPMPNDKFEEKAAKELAELLMLYGTDLHFYSEGDVLLLGSLDYRLLYRGHAYNGERECVLSLKSNSKKLTYFTSGAASICNYNSRYEASLSDVIIIGIPGARRSFDLRLPNIKSLVVTFDGAIRAELENYYASRDIDLIYTEYEYQIQNERNQ